MKNKSGWVRLAEQVRERDNYTCQECNKKWTPEVGRSYPVHHANPEHEGVWLNYHKLGKIHVYLDPIDTLITLCWSCHGKVHREARGILILGFEEYLRRKKSGIPIFPTKHKIV